MAVVQLTLERLFHRSERADTSYKKADCANVASPPETVASLLASPPLKLKVMAGVYGRKVKEPTVTAKGTLPFATAHARTNGKDVGSFYKPLDSNTAIIFLHRLGKGLGHLWRS